MTPMDSLPLFAVFLCTVAGSIACIEIGYQYGTRQSSHASSASSAPLGSLVGSTLALLAFILAFTFGVASSRFDDRRLLVVDEANAIGTAYLRAEYIEPPYGPNVKQILKDYVKIRVDAAKGVAALRETLPKADEMQAKLWSEVAQMAKQHPNLPAYSIFISSVNDLIDIYSKRVNAVLNARVPQSVWLCLFSVAGLAMLGSGYYCGIARSRALVESALMVMAFSSVLLVVVDLDRPWEGSIRVPQEPMIDLAHKLGAI